MTLTWFRVHAVVRNSPGRLIAVHLMQSSHICDWAGSMVMYELAVFDSSWSCLSWHSPGVASSWGTSIEGVYFLLEVWNFKAVAISHSYLLGCLFAAARWSFNGFRDRHTGQLAIDAPDLFGIHLALTGILGFGFGAWHLCSYPGFGVSDVHGITGAVLYLELIGGFIFYNLSGIAAHHIACSIVGLIVGIFDICIYLSLGICSCRMLLVIETVLASSSKGLVVWAAILVASTMWYRSATTPMFIGPTRYQWDNNGLVHVFQAEDTRYYEAWSPLPLRLLFMITLGITWLTMVCSGLVLWLMAMV